MRFGSLMDIDKLILGPPCCPTALGFGSLMDIDKLIPDDATTNGVNSFGSLMDIDKLIQIKVNGTEAKVLVL